MRCLVYWFFRTMLLQDMRHRSWSDHRTSFWFHIWDNVGKVDSRLVWCLWSFALWWTETESLKALGLRSETWNRWRQDSLSGAGNNIGSFFFTNRSIHVFGTTDKLELLLFLEFAFFLPHVDLKLEVLHVLVSQLSYLQLRAREPDFKRLDVIAWYDTTQLSDRMWGIFLNFILLGKSWLQEGRSKLLPQLQSSPNRIICLVSFPKCLIWVNIPVPKALMEALIYCFESWIRDELELVLCPSQLCHLGACYLHFAFFFVLFNFL